MHSVRALSVQQVSAHVAFPALGFLRLIAQEKLQAEDASNLLRCAEHDAQGLCGVVSHDGLSYANFAETLAWDTQFFGYTVARLNAVIPLGHEGTVYGYQAAVAAAREKARICGVRYLMSTVDARETALIQALGAHGFELIETRAFYHRSLTDYGFSERFPTRLATAADVSSLCHAAANCINPFDRFHADPSITQSQAAEMMRVWIENSILHGFADATVVPQAERPTAFCTAKLHREKWSQWGLALAQPVLSAVSADFRGWYIKIISELSYFLKSSGAEHAYMITQITNNAVIRTWERLGYQFGKAQHVFRALL